MNDSSLLLKDIDEKVLFKLIKASAKKYLAYFYKNVTNGNLS